MENNNITVPEKLVQALAINTNIFPCSFNPTELVEFAAGDPDRGTPPVSFLGSGAKRLWFYSYCQSQNKQGRIIPDVDITFNTMELNGAKYGYALAKADVYIDDVLIGSAKVGQAFNMNSLYEMDNVVQLTTGSAVSKALTNAGFGALATTEMDAAPTLHPSAQNGNSFYPQDGNDLPFNYGAAPAAAAPNATPSAVTPNIPPAPPSAGIHAPQHQPSKAELMEMAKQEPWPLNGVDRGKTLGELLATKPSSIEYLALKWSGEHRSKDAAKLLLPEAQRAMGKAVTN